ncbi:hypothetical protein [Tistlia consotensis]|nr:hypothetical protein [Tistlia consotensis]
MSDAELAERLEAMWQAYEEARQEAWPMTLVGSFRGPIRHPLAYPFTSFLGLNAWIAAGFGIGYGFSIDGLLSRRPRGVVRMHLALCEARNLLDEIKRRVAKRAKQRQPG